MLDKHVVKMPTETCQMLHTNLLFTMFKGVYGFEPSLGELKSFHARSNSTLMKPAMLNHPSTIWAENLYTIQSGYMNMVWLFVKNILLGMEKHMEVRKDS